MARTKKNEELSLDVIVPEEKKSSPLFGALLSFLKNDDASDFIFSTLKSTIPDLTSGMIKPVDFFFNEKDNSMHCLFDIKVSDESIYHVEISILRKKDHIKYALAVDNDQAKYKVSFEQTEYSNLREDDK